MHLFLIHIGSFKNYLLSHRFNSMNQLESTGKTEVWHLIRKIILPKEHKWFRPRFLLIITCLTRWTLAFNRLKFSSKHSSCITKWKITANPKILHQTKMTITKNIYPQRRIQVNDIKITEILTNWGKLNNHQIWWSPNIRASKKKEKRLSAAPTWLRS